MKRVYLHPLFLRVWHWVNAAIVLVLFVTGAQLRMPELRIFPEYAGAVLMHKYTGFAMTGSFLCWLVWSVVSGSLRRHYLFRRRDLSGMVYQAIFYGVGLFLCMKNPFTPSPECKFNPLQKVAYGMVMFVFSLLIIVTGILFSDILYFRPVIERIGGVRVLDAIHVALAYVFLLYLAVHVYMSTLGESLFGHVREMITGYAVEHEDSDTVSRPGVAVSTTDDEPAQ